MKAAPQRWCGTEMAHEVRKVGNISSNNRENRLRQEANYKLALEKKYCKIEKI